jgi:hypothetical protein
MSWTGPPDWTVLTAVASLSAGLGSGIVLAAVTVLVTEPA